MVSLLLTCDGDASEQPLLDRPIDLGVAADARQHALREPKALQQAGVPGQSADVHQESPRRVGHVRHMDATYVSSRYHTFLAQASS